MKNNIPYPNFFNQPLPPLNLPNFNIMSNKINENIPCNNYFPIGNFFNMNNNDNKNSKEKGVENEGFDFKTFLEKMNNLGEKNNPNTK